MSFFVFFDMICVFYYFEYSEGVPPQKNNENII